MLIESFGAKTVIEHLKQKENMGGWDSDSIAVIIFTILWFLLWIVTLIVAIYCARQKGQNSQAGLVLSALSWPMYWLFKIVGVIC